MCCCGTTIGCTRTRSSGGRLARAFGCARVVFNDGLRLRQQAREAGLPYLLGRGAVQAGHHRGQGHPGAGVAGRGVGGRAAAGPGGSEHRVPQLLRLGHRQAQGSARWPPPRFRSRKDNRQAIRFTANARFKVLDNGRLRLPKIGDVRVRWSRTLPSDPSSVTVIKDAAGRYFASFVVRTGDEPLPEIGLGGRHRPGADPLRGPLGRHEGHRAEVPAPGGPQAQAVAAGPVPQDQRGRNNRRKAVVKVARAHARVADTRRDWQHKLSTTIIRDNQAVYVEDLCVVGLGRTRLAKSVHDAGWAQFVNMLEYKAARYGRTFGKVGPVRADVATLLDCGRIDGHEAAARPGVDLPVRGGPRPGRQRGDQHLGGGTRRQSNACGAQVRPASVPAPRREAGIHPDAVRCSARSVEGISVP